MDTIRYYYDTFAEVITTTKDEYAPPERYFELAASEGDYYVDTYIVNFASMTVLTFAYTEADSWNKSYEHFYNKLLAHMQSKNLKERPEDLILTSRKYPKPVFDSLIKNYL